MRMSNILSSSYNVVLHCSETNFTTSGSIQFETPPATALDVKRTIESAFSIPVCVQTLTYDCAELHNDDALSSSIRNGDNFHVTYPAEGKCKAIESCIDWLSSLTAAVEEDWKSHSPLYSISAKTSALVRLGAAEGMTENLSLNFFYPWGDKVKYVNKLHFLDSKGLQVLTALHKILLSVPWEMLPFMLQYTEYMCVQSVANFSETFPLRRVAVKNGALQNCCKSLLRRKLAKGEVPTDSDPSNTAALQSTLEVSLYAVCNMSELPECQLQLAEQRDVLQNSLHLSLASCYTSKLSIVVASFFLCLSQSPATHLYLSHPEIVSALLEVCHVRKMSHEEVGNFSIHALHCYTAVVLAQMNLGSPGCIPVVYHPAIRILMTYVLESVDPIELRGYEDKEGLVWSTFIPYLNLLYSPSSTYQTELDILSINILLHTLVNTLGRKLHAEYLCKEHLVGYTVNLPSVLPAECKGLARSAVMELGKQVSLHPPSLSTLARGRLAKLKFGLETMRNVSSVAQFVYTLCSQE